MNYYSTVDNIVLYFFQIAGKKKNGFDEITVYFERPNNDGFDFAAGCNYLIICFYKTHGFLEDVSYWNFEGCFKKSCTLFDMGKLLGEKEGVTVACKILLDFMGYALFLVKRKW